MRPSKNFARCYTWSRTTHKRTGTWPSRSRPRASWTEREALCLDPDWPDAHYSLGLALYLGGDLDGAITEYREALRLSPDDAIAHHNLGIVLDKAGNRQEALKEFRKAYSLQPKDSAYRAEYERLRLELGQ